MGRVQSSSTRAHVIPFRRDKRRQGRGPSAQEATVGAGSLRSLPGIDRVRAARVFEFVDAVKGGTSPASSSVCRQGRTPRSRTVASPDARCRRTVIVYDGTTLRWIRGRRPSCPRAAHGFPIYASPRRGPRSRADLNIEIFPPARSWRQPGELSVTRPLSGDTTRRGPASCSQRAAPLSELEISRRASSRSPPDRIIHLVQPLRGRPPLPHRSPAAHRPHAEQSRR